MPELPEVTTTVKGLNTYCKGQTITDIWCDMFSPYPNFKNTIKDINYFETFSHAIKNKTIINITRRAKYIIFTLSDNINIISHMRMTGHFMVGTYSYNSHKNAWTPDDKNLALHDPYNKHIHVVFSLGDGTHLVYADTRKFGNLTLASTEDIAALDQSLGIEPLTEDFNHIYLQKVLAANPHKPIKATLLDQNKIAGIGNIYCDEACHASNILPTRLNISISEKDCIQLVSNIKKLLAAGIEVGGDSMSDYRDILGEKGKFQNSHQVYKRKNAPCSKNGCTGIIIRETFLGRGTHFCTVCQK